MSVSSPDDAQVLVTGRVARNDVEAGGGVSGVAVSDGLSVTQTNAEGLYQLSVDVRRRRTIMVHITVPTGWQAPVGPFGAPDFWRHVDVADADRVDGVDFALRRDPDSQRDEYRFVTLADVHVQAGGLNPSDAFVQQLEQVTSLVQEGEWDTGRPAFVTVAGDLTNNASPAEFDDYLAATATSSFPVWPAVGNHDLVGRPAGGPQPTSIAHLPYRDLIDGYRRTVGPEWYSFQYGGQHFVILENYRGLSESDQFFWLERDLALHAAGKQVVVISHVPWNMPQTPLRAQTAVYTDLLAAYDLRLLIAGHTHANDVAPDVVGRARQIVTTTTGAVPLDGTPRGFRTVEFYDGRISAPYFELGASRTSTVVHPVGQVPESPSKVLVSRYTPPGVPSEAECRVPPQPWRPLQRAGRRAWTVPLDDVELMGPQELQLRVRDHSADEWSEQAVTFEVTPKAPGGRPRQGTTWPMYHYDAQHSGRTPDSVSPPLGLAWAVHTGGSVLSSSPAITHDAVYLGTRDEDGTDGNAVLALELATGRLRWRAVSDGPVEGSVATADDLVLAAAARGPLRAFDTTRGEVRWTWSPDHPGMPHCWMYFSPTIVDDLVYQAYSVADGTWVACLDTRTGVERWRTKEPLGRNWMSYASPAVADGLVAFATAYANVVAVDAETAEVRWQRTLEADLAVHTKPVIADGLVFLACSGDQLVALDLASGDERWCYTSGAVSLLTGASTGATPAVADGMVYAGFTDGDVAAFALTSGEQAWRYRTAGPVISSPAVSGDVLYVGSHDGWLRALDRQTGECRWSHNLGSWVASSPAVTGNAVVVAAWDGTVYAFTGR